MTQIIAISGSLRAASFNTALVRASVELFPDNVKPGSIEAIPLYNEDFESSEGIPESVSRLKDQIAAADGLLLFTPEYNNSIPGVFKNAIDWLSRPPADIPRVFHDKPVALAGATPGGWGTGLAQDAWLGVLRTLKTRPWFDGRLMVSGVYKLVDENRKLSDVEARERLKSFVGGFIDYCKP